MAGPIRIRPAEDNPRDVELQWLTLEEAKIPGDLEHAEDGVAALEHVERSPHLPDFTLLAPGIP